MQDRYYINNKGTLLKVKDEEVYDVISDSYMSFRLFIAIIDEFRLATPKEIDDAYEKYYIKKLNEIVKRRVLRKYKID